MLSTRGITESLHITLPSPGQTNDEPVTAPDGTVQILFPMPTDLDAHHTELGRFMDTWSRLEHIILSLVAGLLDTKHENAKVIMNALGIKALIDVMLPLASPSLNEDDMAKFVRLTDRLSKLNTKRNYLVHGHWVLEAIVSRKEGRVCVSSQPIREYTPNDPKVRADLGDLTKQKARAKYCFTPSRLKGTANDVERLMDDLADFSRDHDLMKAMD